MYQIQLGTNIGGSGESEMMPFTVWATKMSLSASATVIGAIVSWITILANTDPVVTVIGILVGGGGFGAGLFKMLSDHRSFQYALHAAEGERDRALEKLVFMEGRLQASHDEILELRGQVVTLTARLASLNPVTPGPGPHVEEK